MKLVITGPSGVGKTTVFRWLQRKGMSLPIFELDNFLPKEPRTRNWRLKAYENFVASAPGNGSSAILVGQVPVAEFLTYTGHLANSSPTLFLYLALSEDVRKKRLEDRGWSEEAIEGHRKWHIKAGLDVENISPDVTRVECTGKSVDEIGDEVLKWIMENMQDCSGEVEMNSEPTSRDWKAKLPAAKTLEDVHAILKGSPAHKYYDIYHPLPFDKLRNLRTAVKRAEFLRKSKIIKDAVELIRLEKRLVSCEVKIIDIGANSGGIAFELASCGYDVTAVEPDAEYYALGQTVARLSDTPVNWRNASLGSALEEGEKFHLGLALSVFQWAAKGGSAIETAGKDLLQVSRSCEYMVFEQGFNAGGSCFTTEDPDHYRALLNMIVSYTCYTNFRMLPTTTLYRGQVRHVVLCWGQR